MNKRDLVDAIAAATGFTKAKTAKAVDAILDAVSEALARGQSVTLTGFGTFRPVHRAARTGSNPRTRQRIAIEARTLPEFRPARALRELVAPVSPPAFAFHGTTDGIVTLCGQGVTVAEGSLRFAQPGEENRVVFGEVEWADYDIRVSAALAGGNGYGIYYRADGEPGFQPGITGYCFQYDPGLGALAVRKVTDGWESEPFQSVPIPTSMQSGLGAEHEIAISLAGDHHVIRVDGTVVLDFYDGSFAHGMPGLRGWSSCDPRFSAIVVTLNP